MSIKYTSHTTEAKAEIKDSIKRALEICGGMAERHAVQNIHKNRSIRTSTLVNSITHQKVDDYTMAVGTDVKYAPYVELGHHQEPGRYVPAIGKRLKASFVPAKPFLRPAIENHEDTYRNVIATELNK